MPLFKSAKQSKEAKKRFEHLMVVAKENPNRIFDLSECELRLIPAGLFVQCRVLLTESLILHTNNLKSLKDGGNLSDLSKLKVLDLHNNALTALPNSFDQLANLQVLNLENNRLTELPASIGQLKHLQSLLARDNLMNCLPTSVQHMSSLRTLDISGTNKIYYLPKTLCHVRTLEALILPNANLMEYPPPMVAVEGLEAIQKFICKDCGVDYIPPSRAVATLLTQTDGPSPAKRDPTPSYESAIEQYERAKEKKRKEQLEFERQLANDQKMQAMLSAQANDDKAKSQAFIKSESEKYTQSINAQQTKKDKERAEMVKALQKAESEAVDLVKKLLQDKANSKSREILVEELEKQRRQQEELFRVSKEDLDQQRKEETLAAMELILADNAQSRMAIERYLGEKNYIVRKAQLSIDDDDIKINVHLKSKDKTQEDLVGQILQEERLQKEAFATLLFQRDAVQSRLMDEIAQLEQQLCHLTLLEAKKTSLKMDQDQELLKSIRTELTDLLIELLKHKDEHDAMMKQRLVDMEKQREDDQIDFWLVQYQRLLDTKPQTLIQKEQGLEMEVVKLLRRAGAEHHAPEFARHNVTSENLYSLDDTRLLKIGVFEVGLRQNLLKEIEEVIAEKKQVFVPDVVEHAAVSKPSEQSTSKVIPTAPPGAEDKEEFIDNECVVCLDKSSDCVFLPCGHVCACYACAVNLNQCPMCRKPITQKIKIFRS